MVIGIAGYTGSGKSSAAKYVCDRNLFKLIDADKTARRLMTYNTTLIRAVCRVFDVSFGKKLNFAALGEIAFSSVENLKTLNSITFPYIIEDINAQIKSSYSREIVLDAALLPLISPEKICDFAIWIDSAVDVRVRRLVDRTGLSETVIKNRVGMQMSLMPEPKNSALWSVIDNNSSLAAMLDGIYGVCSKRLNLLR